MTFRLVKRRKAYFHTDFIVVHLYLLLVCMCRELNYSFNSLPFILKFFLLYCLWDEIASSKFFQFCLLWKIYFIPIFKANIFLFKILACCSIVLLLFLWAFWICYHTFLTFIISPAKSAVSRMSKCKWKLLSHVRFFGTPCTVESMEFSGPEHWSG